MKKKEIKITLAIIVVLLTIMSTIVIFRKESVFNTTPEVDNHYIALASEDLISSVTLNGIEANYKEEKGVFYLTAYLDDYNADGDLVILKKNEEYVVTLTDENEETIELTGSKLKLTGKIAIGEYTLKVATKNGNSTKTYSFIVKRSNRLEIECEKTALSKNETTKCTVKTTNNIEYDKLENLSFAIYTDDSKLITSSIKVSDEVKTCLTNSASSNSGKVKLTNTGKCEEKVLAEDTIILEFELTNIVNSDVKSKIQVKDIVSEIDFVLTKELEIKLNKTESNSNLNGAPVVTYTQNGTQNVTLVATNDNKAFYGYVPSDITKINISASAESGKVTGTGEKTLKSGENEFKIIVTAKDETTTEYIIKITTVPKVVETRLAYIKINDKTLTLGTNNVYNVSVPKEDKTVVIKAKSKTNALIVSPEDVGAEELVLIKPLVDGDNTFEITVSSLTGEKQTYKVVVTRTSNNNQTSQGSGSTESETTPSDAGLEKISMGTSAKQYLEDNSTAKIVDKNGKEISGTTIIGTGSKITKNNKSYTVYVLGDVTGDGAIDVADVTKLYQFIHNVIEMDDCYIKAGLVTTNKSPEVNDVAKLYQYVTKKIDKLS